MPDVTLGKTAAQIDAIGDLLYTSSSIDTLANNTLTNLCSIDLPQGRWIVFGQVRINPGSNDATIVASLSGTSGDYAVSTAGGLYQGVALANKGMHTVGLSRIFNVTASAGSTIYLVARQASGAAVSITGAYQIMNAIRIR